MLLRLSFSPLRTFCCLLAALVVWGSAADAQVSYLSVKDYGAKGDGITDDTKAVQQALEKAAIDQVSFQGIAGVYDKTPIYAGGSKIVFFPQGHYRISKSLQLMASYVHIIGEKAILSPTLERKSKSVGIIGNIWQAHIEGMQLMGFDTAMIINNHSIETGKILIEDCDFVGNKVALQVISYGAMCIIRENRFVENQKVALLAGDKVDMSNNWISSGLLQGRQDAQIIANTVLHFDKNLLVPTHPAPGATEPAWINNYREVIINGVRQGGEAGSFTLVNNFARFMIKPFWPNCVIIKESECYAVYGNGKDDFQPAALRLIEVPNMIVLEDLRGFISAKAMDFSKTVTPANTLKNVELAYGTQPIISVRTSNLMGAFFRHSNNSDVPDILQKYIVK